MTPSIHGALVVFGSGPGIGRNVARIFAERGFSKIVVISRNAERLEQDVKFVQDSGARGVSAEAIIADLANVQDTQQALQSVEKSLGDLHLECVLFNAARTGPSKLEEFSVGSFESDLRVNTTFCSF